MKYFSRKWAKANYSEDDKVIEAYWDNLEKIKNQLPSRLYFFAKNIDLHDGLIKHVNYDNNSILSMIVTCGDNQKGYSEISIEYSISPFISEEKIKLLQDIQKNKFEILYDEIDIANVNFVHRLLLYPYKEIEIKFIEFNFQQTCVKNRH